MLSCIVRLDHGTCDCSDAKQPRFYTLIVFGLVLAYCQLRRSREPTIYFGVVAEVEMVGSGIVEVDGALDEAQAEDLGVEIEVALGVGGDRGYVMESNDGLSMVVDLLSLNRCYND